MPALAKTDAEHSLKPGLGLPQPDFYDQIFYKSAEQMAELPDDAVQLVVTSPPYFNIKDYSQNGHQDSRHSEQAENDIGAIEDYKTYLGQLLTVWRECERVLKPNGKLCLNVPLMPMLKRDMNTHHNRHIFDLQSDIQHTILEHTELYLLDLYIWKRTNSSKGLMFGSYPYPRNFYAQNTAEFIAVYVKDGKPENDLPTEIKQESRLSQDEWREFTQQIWEIPIPGRGDLAFGEHPAIMPEAIAYRCIRLFSYADDLVLDPFAGSGTTLKMAKALNRHYVGYEIYAAYQNIIEKKLLAASQGDFFNG